MPVVSSLGKLRQEDDEFLATLSYQTELKSSVCPSSTSGKRDSGGGGREVSSCVRDSGGEHAPSRADILFGGWHEGCGWGLKTKEEHLWSELGDRRKQREEVGGALGSSSIQAIIHLKMMPSRLCIRRNNLSHEDSPTSPGPQSLVGPMWLRAPSQKKSSHPASAPWSRAQLPPQPTQSATQ